MKENNMKKEKNKNNKNLKKVVTKESSTKKAEKKDLKKALINLLNSYKELYFNKLKKKHIVLFIIMIIIFLAMISFFMMNFGSLPAGELKELVTTKFNTQGTKSKFYLSAIIIFAGITPYFFIPVMGIAFSFVLAQEIFKIYVIKSSIIALIFASIGALIQILALSLCVATGIYYCALSTGKMRYNQQLGFGLRNVKEAIYQIKKDEEKLKKLYDKEKRRQEKMEKLNVKIPYLHFVVSFAISAVILLIGQIIIIVAR